MPKYNVVSVKRTYHTDEIEADNLHSAILNVQQMNYEYEKYLMGDPGWDIHEVTDEDGFIVWQENDEVCPDCKNATTFTRLSGDLRIHGCNAGCGYYEATR